jgi:transposase InsO family protein
MRGDLLFILAGAAGVLALLWLRSLPRRLPATHRRLAALRWRWRSRRRGRGGRPPIDDERVDLIRSISLENPLWGAPRIHGELLKLGVRVAQSTVSRYMVPRHRRPDPNRRAFMRDNAEDIASIDMLTVPTVTLEPIYAVVVLGHGRRQILHVDAIDRPSAAWLAQVITEAFPWDEAPEFLVRDNDGCYGLKFRRRLKAMGVRDRHTWPPRSPWQNGWVERLIGSIRRECLDHHIIWNVAHLRKVLRGYADYYNHDRTHLALGKDSPNSRAVEAEGRIVSRPVLGGLHHRYGRIRPK